MCSFSCCKQLTPTNACAHIFLCARTKCYIHTHTQPYNSTFILCLNIAIEYGIDVTAVMVQNEPYASGCDYPKVLIR